MRAFALRLLFVAALVAATYNPEGRSYVHWVLDGGELTPAKAFVGVALTIAWVFVFTTTWRALGFIGTGLAIALVGTGMWLALDWTHASLGARAIAWLVLAGIALVFAGGMSWSSLRRRATGQVDVRDADAV
jgi:hypothetical protein